MSTYFRRDRQIVKKISLGHESGFHDPRESSPAERLQMMRQIAQDCWSFTPGCDVKREFQRHVVRVERRKG